MPGCCEEECIRHRLAVLRVARGRSRLAAPPLPARRARWRVPERGPAPSSQSRILLIEELELVVKVRIATARLGRILEEGFAYHGEEFRRVLGGVRVEPRVSAALHGVAEALVGLLEGAPPG